MQQSFQWFQKGFYILNPSIANAQNEIAFVCHFSGRDSAARPDDLLKTAAGNLLSNFQSRQYDPIVCLYKANNKALTLLDYGWSPTFSPNDARIAYAYQLKPMQAQDKMYASSFSGNSIRVFSTITGKSDEVAKPMGDYLLDPFFIDSLNLLYKTGSEINGLFGGGISFSEVNLKTKKINTVRQAAIKYRLFELMGEPYLLNRQLAYTVYSPSDSGTGMADEYLHLLLRGKDTLQNFGTRRFSNLNAKFAFNDKNELLFLDDGHFLAEDTNYLNTYINNKLVQKRPLNFNYTRGYLSPDGKYIFYITQNLEGFLVNTKNFGQTKLPLPAREFHAVVWSADGRRLALVQDHEALAGTDMLSCFTIH
ncbi:MAG: hypothetical protein QM640_11680 [Niabella sp.]